METIEAIRAKAQVDVQNMLSAIVNAAFDASDGLLDGEGRVLSPDLFDYPLLYEVVDSLAATRYARLEMRAGDIQERVQ